MNVNTIDARAVEATINTLNDTQGGELPEHMAVNHVLGVALAQVYSLKKGLKIFGKQGEEAMKTELKQHHDMKVYHPVDPKSLTYIQKKAALQSLMHLVKKRDGRVRARGCADGSKQRKEPGYKKENAASPTVHNDSTFITCAIDAKEDRDVMVVDLPGAFLHALRRAGATKKQLLMVLRGPLAETMVF